jgi:hypothetical protein
MLGDLGQMWKEAVTAYCKVLFLKLLQGAEENYKNQTLYII